MWHFCIMRSLARYCLVQMALIEFHRQFHCRTPNFGALQRESIVIESRMEQWQLYVFCVSHRLSTLSLLILGYFTELD